MSKKLCFITIIFFLINLFFVFSYSFDPSIQGIDLTTTILVNQPIVSCSFNETQGLCINTNINSFTSESCLACEICNTNPSLLGGVTCNATLCNSLSSCYYNNTTRKCDQNLDKCPTCGNNIREGSEVCDGTDLNLKTCETQGYASGNLTCNDTCSDFNYSACVPPVSDPGDPDDPDDPGDPDDPIPVPTPPSGSNLNKILVLEAEKDMNLSTNIRCDFSTDANLLIKWEGGSAEINNYDCNTQLVQTLHSIQNLPTEGRLEIVATIPQPCDVCQKTVYLLISEPVQTIIPDNNFISGIFMFVLVFALIILRNKKSN